MTSAGTWSSAIMGSMSKNTATFRATVKPPISKKDRDRLFFSRGRSPSPKRMENTAPLPMHIPSRMEVRKVISV